MLSALTLTHRLLNSGQGFIAKHDDSAGGIDTNDDTAGGTAYKDVSAVLTAIHGDAFDFL